MFPVQTNKIFLTPLKARKGGTLEEAVQVTRFRLPAGFARSGRVPAHFKTQTLRGYG
jgi:hypothetical protein